MADAARDEFERIAERQGYRLMRSGDRYASELTQAAWEGWQMRCTVAVR